MFLFDEPLSNLDAKMRVQMRTEISKLHTRLETTMIYVTHDQIEAMTMGDRICVMKDGLIQQVDTPLNIYDHPANTFVAGFIGTPPMNIFRGNISKDGDRILFKNENMSLVLPEAWKSAAEKFIDKEIAKIEAKKIKAETKAAESAKKAEAEDVLKKLLASGMSADEILAKLK